MGASQFRRDCAAALTLLRHPILGSRLVIRRIRDIPSKGLPRLRPKLVHDTFDEFWGVETVQIERAMLLHSPNSVKGNRYEPCAEASVRWACEQSTDRANTTFVDIGSGKGRALIIAAQYNFRAVIGVEYSVDLVKVCRRNLEITKLTNKVMVSCADATAFDFPTGPLFIFMQNPFPDDVFAPILDRLRTHDSRVRIAHIGANGDILKQYGRLLSEAFGVSIYELG